MKLSTNMGEKEKFSSKLSTQNIRDLKSWAKESKLPISTILDEAVSDYLNRVRVRPTFIKAAEEVIAENNELLRLLAK